MTVCFLVKTRIRYFYFLSLSTTFDTNSIANLESILSGYEELRIFSIVTRPRRSEKIDYAQISKYLNQAIFLQNHTPYVDEMLLPRPFIEYSITDLVGMYCFIYVEIKRQLEEEGLIPAEIVNQAQLFLEFNLQPDSSLFSKNHDFTIQLLRSALDTIHRQVSLKDDDYWHFYKAIEDFLYGVPSSNSDGIFWGITSFASVWEDMCIFYLLNNDWKGVWYADSSRDFAKTRVDKFNVVFLDESYENPFYFKMNEKTRHIRPDLVRIHFSDIEQWFEEGVKIDQINSYSYRVSIKIIDKDYEDFFKRFFFLVKKKFPRRKISHINKDISVYKLVNKQGMEQIINELKAEQEKKLHNNNFHTIVDFKYVNFTAYGDDYLPSKIIEDISKQGIYEYAIHLNAPKEIKNTKSQFCIPYFFESVSKKSSTKIQGIVTEKQKLHKALRESDIEILRIDYVRIQMFYNSHY